MDAGRVRDPEEEQEAARSVPAAEPPTAALHAHVLGLQRTIGNTAVTWLLRETDPRLTYTAAAVAEGTGLDAQRLPFTDTKNPDAGWDAEAILRRLTQVDESAATFTDQVRCGANSVLAVAILRGPRDTIAWARAIMRKAYATADDKSKPAADRTASRTLGDKVWDSIAKMERADATYGDLSNIAHHAKVILSNNPTGATTGHEVAAMVGQLGGMQSSSVPMQDKKMFAQYIKESLEKGQAFIFLVDTDVLAHETKTRNLQQANHYVVVAKTKAGQTFLYDPFPRAGDQWIPSAGNNPNFWSIFENAEGDWKSTYLFARPTIK